MLNRSCALRECRFYDVCFYSLGVLFFLWLVIGRPAADIAERRSGMLFTAAGVLANYMRYGQFFWKHSQVLYCFI